MNVIKKHALSDLYDMSSGISTAANQAGHGSPFVSFSTVFNNYFLPDELPDLMDTSKNEQETYSVKKGDILITRTSETIDELAMSCVALKDYPKATYSGFTKRLRPKTKGETYAKYLAFYLRGYLFRNAVTNNAFMTLRASFNEDIFSFLKLYLPDYDEQVKIGDILYLLERKIQLNNRIISELVLMAKTIYDYWFVQFDFPNAEGEPYCASGGEMVWNEQLKRKIPKGWSASRIGDLLDKVPNTSKTQLSDYLPSGKTPVIDQSKDFIAGYTNSPNAVISIPNGAVIFGDHTRIVKYVNFAFARGADGTQVIISKNDCVPNLMLYHSMMKIDLSNNGYARHYKFLKDTSVIVPKKEVSDSFIKIIQPQYKTITKNIFENIELANLRDWLLPILMNGQVTVN